MPVGARLTPGFGAQLGPPRVSKTWFGPMPSQGATEPAQELPSRALHRAPDGAVGLLAALLASVVAVLALWVFSERRSDIREGLAAISYCAEGVGSALSTRTGPLTEDTLRDALGPLVAWPGISRIAVSQEPTGAAYHFDRADGMVLSQRAAPPSGSLGQVVHGERFALTRTYALADPQTVTLQIEGSLEHLVRLHYERLTVAARVLVLTALLGLLGTPWLVRRIVAPWRTAVRGHVRAVIGRDPIEDDPHASLEAAERSIAARVQAELARVASDPGPAQASSPESPPFGAVPIAEVAHGLRTPLLALETAGALLAESVLGPEQRALLRRIQVATASLEALTEDLLEPDAESSQAGSDLLSTFEPAQLIEEVLAYVAPLARGRAVELLPRVDGAVAHSVHGDSARLMRALGHLMEFALHSTEHGVIDLRCAQAARGSDATELLFEVRSTAAPAALVERVELGLTLAARGPSHATSIQSLPLGLHLASRAVHALGGEVDLHATTAEGLRFRCRVPVRPLESAPQPPTLEGQRALVIDERPRSGAHLADLLIEEGADVVLETSTYAGYEVIQRGAPVDLILLSAIAPGRDALIGGLEASSLRGARMPRVVLVHPILGRHLPLKGLDEAVAAQIVEPVSQAALRRALLEVIRDSHVAEPERAALAPAPAPATRTNESPVKVLLVDDNETNRQLVQFLLMKRGYVVDVAADGAEAVDAFAVGEFDVVLMDCQMPVMDGFEATRRMRALEHARARRTPILAMSAGTFGEDIQACRAAGMDDHIGKPFQPNVMLAWLERWVAATLDSASGEVRATPRGRISARAAGLIPTEPSAPLPSLDGAIDRSVLGPLLDDDSGRALAQDLKQAFEQGTAQVLEEIGRALAGGDFERVGRAAHRFVSTSGTVGAVRLARLLREVESASRQRQTDVLSGLVARLTPEAAVAQRALDSALRA